MLKKVATLLLAVVLLLAVHSTVFALSETGFENSPVYEEGPYSYINQNNPDVRFDVENHRMAVPGQGGSNAAEGSAIIEWGEGSLVSPHKVWP